jgi:hypothetical protein
MCAAERPSVLRAISYTMDVSTGQAAYRSMSATRSTQPFVVLRYKPS